MEIWIRKIWLDCVQFGIIYFQWIISSSPQKVFVKRISDRNLRTRNIRIYCENISRHPEKIRVVKSPDNQPRKLPSFEFQSRFVVRVKKTHRRWISTSNRSVQAINYAFFVFLLPLHIKMISQARAILHRFSNVNTKTLFNECIVDGAKSIITAILPTQKINISETISSASLSIRSSEKTALNAFNISI